MDRATSKVSENGDDTLSITFELGLADVLKNKQLELAFGFQNGNVTESGSFFRDRNGNIDFESAYEKGSLMETRGNVGEAFPDTSTWTGTAVLDEKNGVFRATATRKFLHGDKNRELQTGAKHNWGTIFVVKDANSKIIAEGQSQPLSMILTGPKTVPAGTDSGKFLETGASYLSLASTATLALTYALLV